MAPKLTKNGYFADWGTSKARAKLLKDIFTGAVSPDSSWEEVYNDSKRHTLYKNYDPESFQKKLEKCREHVTLKMQQSLRDFEAFNNTFEYYPRHLGSPWRWDGSDAQMLLREMVKDGAIGNMKPSEVWEIDDEFQKFPLKKFRDHLQHEKRRSMKYQDWRAYTTRRRQKLEQVLQHDEDYDSKEFFQPGMRSQMNGDSSDEDEEEASPVFSGYFLPSDSEYEDDE